MTAKRFNIKPQDDYFGIVDNYSADKVCVINGIRTEIEAEWLCKDMNTLNDENEQLKERLDELKTYDKEEFTEAEYINDIYKEKGFCGVIEYAKDKLQYYGVVEEVEKGL